jgi:phospholipid transport system substrate-binding protein
MMHRICLSTLFISFLTFSTAYAGDDNKPGMIVQDTVNQVLEILTDDELGKKEKRAKSYVLVGNQINFPGMSRRILAINWNKSSDEQKQRFEKLIRQILLNTYWQRIKNYNGEKVEYITGMIDGNRFATVDTVIVSDKIDIPITYRMELIDGTWVAYDFLIESLSLVTRYRTEYRNIIKTHGIEGLLKQMQKRVDAQAD